MVNNGFTASTVELGKLVVVTVSKFLVMENIVLKFLVVKMVKIQLAANSKATTSLWIPKPTNLPLKQLITKILKK